MYQHTCKKCNSVNLCVEVKGNHNGLYCSDCGAWIKWLSKDELRIFEHNKFKQENKINEYPSCINCDMAIDILDFIKRGYEQKYQDAGVQKYIDALQMGINAIKKDRGDML